MEKEKSLRSRAFLAVVLFFGFYLLALAVVAGLISIPYLQWKAMDHVTAQLALSCLGGAAIILWSIAPRPDRFEPPGPRLLPSQQPRFFKTVETIAGNLGQKMPREVYLIPISNAWVASRGGVMGFGSRRVMAVGIPLLQTLSVPEFTAVLAHEFGHYSGGDVKLGPWIYKTRMAIARTILGLQKRRPILQTLFIWYGNFFLKITGTISRGQELAADRMAAAVAGAASVASALRHIHNLSLVFDVYWQEDVIPVLQKGFYPPLVTGFGQFLSSQRAREMLGGTLEKVSAEDTSDPSDSHPTLDVRLTALGQRGGEGKEIDSDSGDASPVALSLLDMKEDEIEQTLLAWVQGTQKRPLTSVSWQDVGRKVWRDIWKEGAALFVVELVSPATAADFPRLISKEMRIPPAKASPPPQEMELEAREISRRALAVHKYGSALADALIKEGWIPEVLPGETVNLDKGGVRFKPFEYVGQLADGKMDEERWRELCREAGILDLRFGS